VEHLLEWANANYPKATNLPSKPHAVIALNKSDHMTPDDQWSSINATANLLKSTTAQINKNSTFRRYADKWKSYQSRVRDMEDLLKCYYSTVHVVRLPDKSRFQRMHDQREELYSVIINCCKDSHETKMERNMLPDVDEFGLYLSLAFDHFSESLDEPFDFVAASLKYQPVPDSMQDNMKRFVFAIGETQGMRGRISELFTMLTPMIASCLMLDSARKQRIGTFRLDCYRSSLAIDSS
jgi:hypothetical protein